MRVAGPSVARVDVERVRLDAGEVVNRSRRDLLAAEEPLEIRVREGALRGSAAAESVPLAVTMRTPGADFDLVAGFLYAEGVVDSAEELRSIRYCVSAAGEAVGRFNRVTAELVPGLDFDAERHGRNFYSSSSCGVCGKESIAAVLAMPTHRDIGSASGAVEPEPVRVSTETLLALPGILRQAQAVFDRTGGLHAAAAFDVEGRLLRLREDIGRHNALDKLIGAALLAGELPLSGRVVLVSGRLGFELVQKAARAGVRILAGVSAPSSLAVDLAASTGMTLIGFLREARFNIYSGRERIELRSRPRSL